MSKRELLYDRAMKAKEPHGSGSVSFQEFVNVVSQQNNQNDFRVKFRTCIMRTIVMQEKLNAKNVEKSRISKPKREKQADTDF